MTHAELQRGALYEVEETRGFGKTPEVYHEIEFLAARHVLNWRTSTTADPGPAEVLEFLAGGDARILVPEDRLVSARLLKPPSD